MEMEESGRPCLGGVEMPRGGLSDTVDNVVATRRSAVAALQWRAFWRIDTSGYGYEQVDERTRLLSHWTGVAAHERKHPDDRAPSPQHFRLVFSPFAFR
jgi:hypothetical protein